MGQYLSWIANVGLFVLCCFLVADTANSVFAAMLTPSLEQQIAAPDGPAPSTGRSDKREVIIARNLFNASTLAPPAPPTPEPEPVEDLEESRLPFKLLGTASSSNPALSHAAVQDEMQKKTLVVKINDDLAGKATVRRIERRRIVISEDGVLRELKLDDEPAVQVAARRAPRAAVPRRGRRIPARTRQRLQPTPTPDIEKLAEDRFRVSRDDVEEVARNASELFSQARILPKYEEGEIVGFQVNAIKPGSVFEALGVKNGEVITQVNGIEVTSPEQSSKILSELSDAESLAVVVEGEDGPRNLQIDVPGGSP